MIRCKGCETVGSIVMVDLMPRILGVDDEGDPAPERLDEDEYESSTTIGYGCRESECRFWSGDVGNLSLKDGLWTASGGFEWEEVAEKHTADHCQDCWYEVNGDDQYLPDVESDMSECAKCGTLALVYPTFGDPIADRQAKAVTVEAGWSA